MAQLQLPEKIRGAWIWKSGPNGDDDVFILARKTFENDRFSLENTFWISAKCAYSLIINERFCGFGPRANQQDAAFVDRYDISRYLQDGLNTVSLFVYSAHIPYCPLPPGFWCQLESGGEMLLCSDESWDILSCDSMSGPRPRTSPRGRMTEFIDQSQLPEHWLQPHFEPDRRWSRPDRIMPVCGEGVPLEIYPLPPSTTELLLEFSPVDYGRVEPDCAWTQVLFDARCRHGRASCGGECFIYSEINRELPLKLFSDDPYKLFCNETLISAAPANDGTLAGRPLPLRRGWNRLLAIQQPGRNSMGLFLLFPERAPDSFRIYQQPDDGAPECWTVAGPLRLPLDHASCSLSFEGLETGSYCPGQLVDAASLLKNSSLTVQGTGAPPVLRTGEFVRYRLDVLRYGCPMVEVEASEGDIIDITFGYKLADNGLPSRGNLFRATHSMKCRNGGNRFMLFNPREGFYLMVSVRKARNEVRIIACNFEELLWITSQETEFSCSDEEINRLWRLGVQTLRRSSAFIPQIESHAQYDNYLLDSYFDAVNMVGVFGAFDYSAARLRQFVEAQVENGDIPVLTFAKRSRSQAHQLFFLPVWMLYNYRVSGDLAELRKIAPGLEKLRRFYLSLTDPETGLIGELDHRFEVKSPLAPGKFEEHCIPTYANALFCRFLLSSSEVMRIIGQNESAASFLEEAKHFSRLLLQYNYDPKSRLFAKCSLVGPWRKSEKPCEFSLFANLTALMSGVMPLENFDHFFQRYFNAEAPYDRSQEAANPYFHYLFLETMYALRHGPWANKYLREYWKKRDCRENGTFLNWHDNWSPAPIRFYDGNVVSPNIFLIREVAGIRVLNSDHTSIYFNPALLTVKWARLSMPTAFGEIRFRWEKNGDELSVDIDSTYPVKVLPELSAEQLRHTAFSLSPNVLLLAPPNLEE